MERLVIDQERLEYHREYCRASYPGYEKPIPGSLLQQDDDIEFLGCAPMRLLWGHDHPDFCNGYGPDFFSDVVINFEALWITDRAPVDEEEQPMPIWPPDEEEGGTTVQQQQQQPQGRKGGKKPKRKLTDEQRALEHVLIQIPPQQRQAVRERIRSLRPELLPGDEAQK